MKKKDIFMLIHQLIIYNIFINISIKKIIKFFKMIEYIILSE